MLDPIDGTKNFVRGVPVWATLIALLDGDEPVVGLVSAPALNKRWWAAKDVGAWTGRRLESATRCRVSEVTDLADARLSYSSLSGWEERDALDGFLDLTRSVWRTRAYGDFWSYCLVAEGAVDIAGEPEVSVWDLAALDMIVREAGGQFTDLSGAARSGRRQRARDQRRAARRRPRPRAAAPPLRTSTPLHEGLEARQLLPCLATVERRELDDPAKQAQPPRPPSSRRRGRATSRRRPARAWTRR